MQKKDNWEPTKFVIRNKKLRVSRNKKNVDIGSRLSVNLIAKKFDKYLPVYCKGRLIDIGCGQVPLYGTYKAYVSENVCVDWNDSFHEMKHVDVFQNLNEPFQFEGSLFDTALLSDVLEHIRLPEQLIGEIYRILKPEGVLIMNVPFMYCLHETPHDYFRYTRYALESILALAGFKVLIFETIGGSPEVLADVFAKNAKKIPLIGVPVALFAQWSCFQFVKTKIGRKVSNKTSEKFPLGYFVVAEKR